MKGVGNYSTGLPPRIERKPAQLVVYHGDRAAIRLLDGLTHSIPAAPLKQLKLEPGNRFVVVTTFKGSRVADIHFELFSQARPAIAARQGARVYVLTDGKRVLRTV